MLGFLTPKGKKKNVRIRINVYVYSVHAMPAWMAVTTNKHRYRFEQRYLGLPVILIHEIKWGIF